MAYELTDNFAGGVDRTRPRSVGTPGTLWSGINGHLTRGGDFEKRKAFDTFATLSAGTVGLAKTSAGLYVFGSGVAPSMPSGVSYQRLQHPTDPTRTLTKVQSWDLFAGQIYAIGLFDNGDVRHYYNGAIVSNWNSGSADQPAGYGSICRTHKRKVYSPITSLLWYSKLDTGNVFDSTQSGSGYNNMSTHLAGSDEVTALGAFQSLLAVFSRRVIQVWNMQDDNALNAPAQFLEETGTRSPRSVRGFGDLDAFYLSDSGIRSLRSRTVSNIAGVNDVGTPIDTLVTEYMATLTDQQVIDAIGVVDPKEGRFWLALGTRIFVFTYFPSKKISGWTWYDPGIEFTELVTLNDRVYGRAGDTIYLYGGVSGSVYDSCRVTVEQPFLRGGKPGTYKQLRGLDINATGEWACKVLVDPRDETQYVDYGTLDGYTFLDPNDGGDVNTTAYAPVFVNEAAGYASISQAAVYNEPSYSE